MRNPLAQQIADRLETLEIALQYQSYLDKDRRKQLLNLKAKFISACKEFDKEFYEQKDLVSQL
jgi:hypothetical protein